MDYETELLLQSQTMTPIAWANYLQRRYNQYESKRIEATVKLVHTAPDPLAFNRAKQGQE